MTNKVNKKIYKYEDLEILRHLDKKQDVSQRALAEMMGISLGKINFILNALINKGAIKVTNFKNNKNKLAYAYYLTPAGIKEKAFLTIKFFQRKTKEYDTIRRQIEELEKDMKKNNLEDMDLSNE